MGFAEDTKNLLLLTRECVGKYKLMELEDSLVYADGREGSEKTRKSLRPKGLKRPGVVEIVKKSSKIWKIGGLLSFCPAGGLRHSFIDEDEDKITEQDWIEENNLVSHGFTEWDKPDSEDFDGDEEAGQDDSNDKKFGVESRVVVTFYKDWFVYKEKAVNTRRCSNCKSNCSYEYKLEACFAKI